MLSNTPHVNYAVCSNFRRLDSSFLTCGVSNNIDGSEDSILRPSVDEGYVADLEDEVGDLASFSKLEEG